MLPRDPDERRRAWLAFGLFAALMASYYVFKSARDSLFLHYSGARNLPYAHIGSTLIAATGMWIYNRTLLALGGRRLLRLTIWVLIVSGSLFFPAWLLVSNQPPAALVYAFYFYVSLYGVVAATVFWTAANDSFDTELGKKIYGFIGAGGIAGSFVGGMGTTVLVWKLHFLTEWILPVGSLLLLVALPLLSRLFAASPPGGTRLQDQKKEGRARDGLYYIFTDRYVGLIAVLVVLMTAIGTLFDLQYKHIIEQALPGKEAKTIYVSSVFAAVSVTGVLIQLVLTPAVLKRFGPVGGLVFLPAVALGGVAVLLFFPTLWPVAVISVLAGATLYSINQSAKEILYIPTPETVRYGSKGFIDVLGFRLGDGVGSVLALGVTRLLGLATASLVWVCLLGFPLWVLVLRGLRNRWSSRSTPS